MPENPYLFKRYVWLIDTMRRHPEGLTLEQVREAWRISRLNNSPEKELCQHTFIRHREAVADLFGIEIVCRKSDNTYLIRDCDAVVDNSIAAWMINTLAIEGRVRNNPAMRARILLDAVPAGEKWLGPLVEAMEHGRCVELDYSSFHHADGERLVVAPYCLKMYGRRWYLLGRVVADGAMLTYGLDRIMGLREMNERFKYPADFDPEAFFADYMGVITDDSREVERVKVSIDEDFAPHLRNVPLHPTQIEGKVRYEDGSEDVTFEWRLKPTPDFLMELYRYGSSLEVMRPQWIRETIAAWAAHHDALYRSE